MKLYSYIGLLSPSHPTTIPDPPLDPSKEGAAHLTTLKQSHTC